MNDPEAQGEWRRLHPLTPLIRSTQLLYALVIGAFAGLSAGYLVFILLFVGAAVGISLQVVAYLHYRYRLTPDELLIVHGILFRKERVIPRSRIQNVDLRSGIVQRIVGTTSARIETAGGQGTEASLHVVSREEGVRLRQLLVEAPPQRAATVAPASDAAAVAALEGEATVAPPSPQSPAVEHRVGVLDLVIAGATANRAGLLVGALLGGDIFLDIAPTDWILRRVLPPELLEPGAAAESLYRTAQQSVSTFLLGVFLLAIFFILAGWAVSVAASVVRYFDFCLKEHPGELEVSYGLFTRREKGFRRSRVQNVQIEEPILRRWLRLASLSVRTAGYGPGVKQEDREETLTPIARHDEITRYMAAVYPDLDWESVQWRRSHPRARRRLFLRRAAAVLAVTLPLAAFVDPVWLSLLVGLIPAWLLAAAHYRHLGHARVGPYLLVREGFWTRRTHIIPIKKIQALHLKQTPFQRRLHLATLSVETAGNPLDLRAPRTLDLGLEYGESMLEGLATEVSATGLTF